MYGRQTIGHYSNSSNRHTAEYIYSAAQTVCFCCTVTVSCTQTHGLCTLCVQQSTVTVLNSNTFTSSRCTEANNKLCTKYSHSGADRTVCDIVKGGRYCSTITCINNTTTITTTNTTYEQFIKSDTMTMTVFTLWL